MLNNCNCNRNSKNREVNYGNNTSNIRSAFSALLLIHKADWSTPLGWSGSDVYDNLQRRALM